MKITSYGIWFNHNGDEVCWIFPWHRTSKHKKFLSEGFECSFNSLKDIDELWDLYFKEINEDPYRLNEDD